ncbi:pH-sensitive chloride channel 2 isoform X3 [Bemisia tabaci]|uniref:pH-sensitive chloride channel 2 isoform X3 n=1 Tax=Bemisia tabaci TaxID=7038 RepID=UPI003B27BE36
MDAPPWFFLLGLVQLGFATTKHHESRGRIRHNMEGCHIPVDRNSSATDILSYLTHPCRYNPRQSPPEETPIAVDTRMHIYYLESEPTYNLQFKAQMLLQLKWKDRRLSYKMIDPALKEIHTSHRVVPKIWTPYVYLTNEKNSLILRSSHKDVLVSFLPDGEVLYTTRLKSTIFCWAQLGKFPFDHQRCQLILDSWRYSSENLILRWELNESAIIPEDVRYLGDYKLISMTPKNGLIPTLSKKSTAYSPKGISTMLTLLALSAEVGSSLPNVSYIRSNDVWFVACTAFIMLSLIELAFINSLWRKNLLPVFLKKPTSKYIIKSSLSPKRAHRRRSLSVPSSPEIRRGSTLSSLNQFTVKSLEDLPSLSQMFELRELRRTVDEGPRPAERSSTSSEPEMLSSASAPSLCSTTMTTQDIALWIDRKSRVVFPFFFVLFNLFYWTLIRY